MSMIAQIEQMVRSAVSAALSEVLEKLVDLEGRIRDLEDQVGQPDSGPAKKAAAPTRNVRAQAETAHAKGAAK